MPERAFAVDAPDGREAQVTETGNQPRRLRLGREVKISALRHSCEVMRSQARSSYAYAWIMPYVVAWKLPPATVLSTAAPKSKARHSRTAYGAGKLTAQPAAQRHHPRSIGLTQRDGSAHFFSTEVGDLLQEACRNHSDA